MKLKYYYFSGLLLLLSGCVSNDYADTDARDAQVDANVKKVFGVNLMRIRIGVLLLLVQ